MIDYSELEENGIVFFTFFDKQSNPVDVQSQADTVSFCVKSGEKLKLVSAKVPKKEIDTTWVLEKAIKTLNRQSINYSKLFSKAGLASSSIYAATYGFGVQTFLRGVELKKDIEKVEKFLAENDIKFKTEFSEGFYIYRFKISQTKENIDKVREALS